jgi:hypothetical protein
MTKLYGQEALDWIEANAKNLQKIILIGRFTTFGQSDKHTYTQLDLSGNVRNQIIWDKAKKQPCLTVNN